MMFSLKILTAIANKMIPKTRRIIPNPEGPILVSSQLLDFSTTYITTILTRMAIKILLGW